MAAQERGDEYDYLKDRTLFLFPFDKINYAKDLMREVRKHRNVSYYPLAENFVPAKYIDRVDAEQHRADIRGVLKMMYDRGYTYEDLMRDNWRTRGSGELYLNRIEDE